MIDVLCDDEVRSFYEKLGFQAAGGAMVRRYDQQSGKPTR